MKTAICIASGPSLTPEDVDYCRGKAHIYAVNDTYKLAPWADVLYGCDFEWWKEQFERYKDDLDRFAGDRWTINKKAADQYDLNLIGHFTNIKWSNNEKYIATGGNSGFQAVNLAVLHGAKRVILLGYDMKLAKNKKRHFFGDHPLHLNRSSDYKSWIKKFIEAKPQIPVEIINCTRSTALECFPQANLKDVL